MGNFQTSFESNTTKANHVISNLGTTLHYEKTALEKLRTCMRTDYTEFQLSISSKITKLPDDFEMENKIMMSLQ